MSDDVALLQLIEQQRQRRNRLAHMDHHRQVEGGRHFLRPPEHLNIPGPGHIPGQSRLDDEVAVLRNRISYRADIGAVDIHGVAFGQDAGTTDIDQAAALLRRRLCDRDHVGDVIGALRSRIDPARHAVLQNHPRAPAFTAAMGVDVNETRGDDLAARIDGFRRSRRDVGFDCGNAPARDRHVANRVQPR
ncbi:MAG: hypothetical protein EXQ52_00245 [Bryobacterales bacterium]|nr:hypothetical protein [Bryobacterales bacterium]